MRMTVSHVAGLQNFGQAAFGFLYVFFVPLQEGCRGFAEGVEEIYKDATLIRMC